MLDFDYNIHIWLSRSSMQSINQSSFNQSEDSSLSINKFNPKGSKYPINKVRGLRID
jgi:hypothetical protein